ncbi:MAG: moeA1 [Lachnospiraceae bacterium]|jgi:molybdopterin molybdotransferase|nr:moeA1 [Lachnospiraceae bacterium]
MELIGIELEQAVELVLQYGAEQMKTHSLPVMKAGGSILAEDIYAPIYNPPFDRSPLDGFALRACDSASATKDHPVCLLVIDTVYAGEHCVKEVKTGEAVRIMTGAPIPLGADCVIRQEDTSFHPSNSEYIVEIYKELKHHENYCFQGEDVKKGQLLIEAGTKITYIEQGILASIGITQVTVYQKPRVALFVTGDEVVPPGSELKKGKIYDSNLSLIYNRLREFGMEPVIAEYLPDHVAKIADSIRKVSDHADIIITTGGVSVGVKDIFHEVVPMLDISRIFWKVNLKPGTPAMFSVYQGIPLLNLSGNPFAAITTFELLARPLLAKMSCDKSLNAVKLKGTLAEPFTKTSGARRFLRGRYSEGKVHIPPTEKHASGILTSMSGCNCLVDIKAGSKPLTMGDEIEVILL